MSEKFDAYYEWLGIPPKHQPPNHYRLLGIELFEQNANVIERGADRQMTHVRTFQAGRHAKESQRLLNELSTAKICLLDPQKRAAYDAALRQQESVKRQVAGGDPDGGVQAVPRQPADPAKPIVSELPAFTRGRLQRPPRQITKFWVFQVVAASVAIISLAIVLAVVLSRSTDDATQTGQGNVAANPAQTQPAPAQHPGSTAVASIPPNVTVQPLAARPASDRSEPSPAAPTPSPDNASPAPSAPMPSPPPTPVSPPPATPAPAAPAAKEGTEQPSPVRLVVRQAVSIQGSAGMVDPAKDFTAEIWFRPATSMPPAGNYVMGSATVAEGTTSDLGLSGWQIAFVPSGTESSDEVKLVARWGKQTGKAGETSTVVNRVNSEWHHLAVCVGASQGGERLMRVWLDGKQSLQQKLTPGELRTGSNDFCVGVPPEGPKEWAVLSDVRGVRLSSTVRYSAEFTPEVDLAKDDQTVCLLDFRGAAPNRLDDLSGRESEGRIQGGTRIGQDSEAIVLDAELMTRLPARVSSEKQPAPPREVIAKEVSRLRESLKKEITAANEPPEQVALCVDLLRKSRGETSSTTRYALLDLALETAIAAGNAQYALRIIPEIESHFRVDVWTMRADSLVKLAPNAKSYTDRRAAAELAICLADRAMEGKAFEAAEKLLGAAQKASGRVRDPLLTRMTSLRSRELSAAQKMAAQLEAAQRQLDGGGTSAEDNAVVGRYLIFLRNDWEAGWKYLAAGKESAIQDLAKKELAQPASADDQLALGNTWLNWAKTAGDTEQNTGWLRAQHWIELAVPQLKGPEQVRANKELEELSSKATPRTLAGTSLVDDWLQKPAGELLTIPAHGGPVTALAVARSGRWVITAGGDGLVRAWDLFNGKQLSEIQPSVNGINSISLLPDERFVMVSGSQQAIEIWNLANHRRVRALQTDAAALELRLSDDGTELMWLKAADNTKNIILADPATASISGQLDCPGTPTRLALSKSGKAAAVANNQNGLGVFGLPSLQRIALPGHTDAISDLQFSPDGRSLASASASEIIIWDLSKAKPLHKLPRSGPPPRVAFLPDATSLIEAGLADELSIWNVRTGSSATTLRGSATTGAPTNCFAVLPHGLAAVAGTGNGEVRVWRLPDD